ncbi:MAG TPA: iron-containing alcohol dehydrogenase [Bacillota bacterium]
MKSFQLISQFPQTVFYGAGTAEKVEEILGDPRGKKVLIVTDSFLVKSSMIETFSNSLTDKPAIYGEITGEPTSEEVEKAVRFCREGRFDLVIGIGGGSVLDTAKVVAALGRDQIKVSQVYGAGKLKKREIGLALIPTTAGTGSEATPNSLIFDSVTGNKEAIIGRELIPDWVVLDPVLTTGLPPKVTAATGLDALCHCIESYYSVNSNPVSEAYSYEGLKLLGANLGRAVEEPDNLEVRGDMLLGSFFGGLGLTIAGTTAVHALSYPLGKRRVAHGVANGMLLPKVLEYYFPHIEGKLNQVFRLFATHEKAVHNSRELLDMIAGYVSQFPIPKTLAEVNISADEIPQLAKEAVRNERLIRNNPGPVTIDDAEKIYRMII